MKQFLSLLALMFFSSVSLAKPIEINVLRLAPPGGGTAMWADAMMETLKDQGYAPKLIGFKSCKDGYNWFKANPEAPVVFASFTDYAILDILDPTHPAGCGFEFNEKTLVGISGRWWNFICGHKGKNDSIQALQASKDAKVGVWNYPISMNVAQAHIKALGSQAKVIGFASGKQQMLAFTSGDLDYIVLSTESMARSMPDANCFATSAPSAQAREHMPTRVAYDSVAPVPFNGFGLWPIIGSANVDVAKLRAVFKNAPSDGFKKMLSNYVPETSSIAAQLQTLRETASSLQGSLK